MVENRKGLGGRVWKEGLVLDGRYSFMCIGVLGGRWGG